MSAPAPQPDSRTSRSQRSCAHHANSTAALRHPDLVGKRCLNPKLIYVMGIPAKAANYDLKSERFFGRFGPVKSVTVNQPIYQSGRKLVTAHILYIRSKDALLCLYCTNISTFCNLQMFASIGTTQYCVNFLRGKPCHISGCSFQHSEGELRFQFWPNEMNQSNPSFTMLVHPSPPPMIEFVPCDFDEEYIPIQPDFPQVFPFAPLTQTQNTRSPKRVQQQKCPVPPTDPGLQEFSGFLPESILQEISVAPRKKRVHRHHDVGPPQEGIFGGHGHHMHGIDERRMDITEEDEERLTWEHFRVEPLSQTQRNAHGSKAGHLTSASKLSQ